MGFFDFSVNKVKIPVQVIQTCMIFNSKQGLFKILEFS